MNILVLRIYFVFWTSADVLKAVSLHTESTNLDLSWNPDSADQLTLRARMIDRYQTNHARLVTPSEILRTHLHHSVGNTDSAEA